MYCLPIHPYEISNVSVKPLSSHNKMLSMERYKPFSFNGIQGFPNSVPTKVREYLPKFTGKGSKSARRHLQEFYDLMGDFEINQEDILMKFFVQSLKEDARVWFSYLPLCSIFSWDELKLAFMEQFGERVDLGSIIKRFMDIQKKEDELIPPFNLRFARILDDILSSYRPNDTVCSVVYLYAFEEEMSYLLREKDPKTMHHAYKISMDIENNLKYGISKGYLSARICYPKMIDVEERCEPKSEDQCQSTCTRVDHNNHVMNYDSNKNMSKEKLYQTVVIPHVNEEKVSEIISVITPYDNNNSFFSKEIPQEVHLQSRVLGKSNNMYEELKSYTSDEDNANVQDFDDINSVS